MTEASGSVIPRGRADGPKDPTRSLGGSSTGRQSQGKRLDVVGAGVGWTVWWPTFNSINE